MCVNTIQGELLRVLRCMITQHIVPRDVAARAQDARLRRGGLGCIGRVAECYYVSSFHLLHVCRCWDCEFYPIRSIQ